MDLNRAAALIEKHGAEKLRKSLGVWREELRLSQQDLASMADVAQQTVSRIERGSRNLTPQVLARLTNAMLKKEAEASKARGGKMTLGTLMRILSPDAKELRELDSSSHDLYLRSLLQSGSAAHTTQDRVKDRLIEAQKKMIENLKQLIANQEEIIRTYRDWSSERDSETSELEARIAELRDLLGFETERAMADSSAQEIRERIAERETVPPKDGDD